jgi:hypothetical protein
VVIVSGGAAVTVRAVLPLTLPEVAVMVLEPALKPVASPAALTVATVAADVPHVTWLVRFCVELSE